MAKKEKKPIHKVEMTEGKRQIIQQLLQEYDIETAADIQEALKDLLGGTIEYSGVAEPPVPALRATPIPVARARHSGNENQCFMPRKVYGQWVCRYTLIHYV